MTYNETLEWMFAQLPVYQHKGKTAYNGKLDNIIKFSDHLDNPEKKFKSIHVAGTNGKGSSSHMLASILQEANYKVGLYTSPHLKDFRERIRINGNSIVKKNVVEFIEQHKTFLEENMVSFFEMTVAMAFDYFAKEEVDIAIIEVGLGGRLDSTNIITPEVSLITNIGLDHIDLLGNSLQQIASEKGGIIKVGVPVVVSELQEEVAHVFKSLADANNTKLIFADQEVNSDYKTDLLGQYQKKNIGGVVTALKNLKGFDIREEHFISGLMNVVANTGLIGRWQLLGDKPMIVCDTAHNKEGLLLVLNQLKEQKVEQMHFVLGFVSDKDLDAILPLFPKDAHYYFSKPNIYRGLDSKILLAKAAEYKLLGESYDSVNQALLKAKDEAKQNDLIFIGGSNFTVAEVV